MVLNGGRPVGAEMVGRKQGGKDSPHGHGLEAGCRGKRRPCRFRRA